MNLHTLCFFRQSLRRSALTRCLLSPPAMAGALSAMMALGPGTLPAQQAPLRVAIVGLVHGHVEGFIRAFPQHPDVELVGISEPDAALRAKYARQDGLAQNLFFADTEAMIAATHPQALLVYTSIAGHRKVIEEAAAHHLDVMAEKPLTISLADALAIRRAARQHHIHVLVNYETTWYASNRFAYDELESGKLGPVRRVVVEDGHQGPKEIGVQPEFLNWLTDPAQNGAGALYDFGCYGVDLMTWMMHGEAPLTVTAVTNHDKPQIYPRVDDAATIILQYPHAQAIIQPSWNWPFSVKNMQVFGATGYAFTVGADHVRLRLKGDEQEQQLITAPPLAPPQNNSLNYLAGVISGKINDKGDLSGLDTNVTVMQILDAARQSAREGRTIKLTKLPED